MSFIVVGVGSLQDTENRNYPYIRIGITEEIVQMIASQEGVNIKLNGLDGTSMMLSLYADYTAGDLIARVESNETVSGIFEADVSGSGARFQPITGE
jgi:hypothetical protein